MSSWGALVDEGVLEADVQIGSLTTYKLGGAARWMANVEDRPALQAVVAGAVELGIPILILGRGSNLVVADDGFDGVVIRMVGAFRDVVFGPDDLDHHMATAGAAVPLPTLARTAAQRGLGGVEFYVGIPGTVGGAVVMNAGFYGRETADVVVSADVMDVTSGQVSERPVDSLDLSYRHSAITGSEIVLGAAFRLSEVDSEAALAEMRAITQWRKERQPGGTFNAGSVFKNPPDDHAGRIIDELGLKGFTCGGAQVSERHANFFVADQHASAQDVYDLVHAVRRRVHERAGVLLEPEIRFMGEFRRSPDEVSV